MGEYPVYWPTVVVVVKVEPGQAQMHVSFVSVMHARLFEDACQVSFGQREQGTGRRSWAYRTTLFSRHGIEGGLSFV